MNCGTKNTMPFYLWKDAVINGAIAAGAEADAIKNAGDLLNKAFNNGEPVWMATDEMALRFKGFSTRQRIANEPDRIREIMKKSIVGDLRLLNAIDGKCIDSAFTKLFKGQR